mmetsp:Transcript_6047/g.13371  ORF Transcript_6047/g.13371 Transcript_6047/m.13371 type:complete len:91 (-) Transcript_6047:157-429(-)
MSASELELDALLLKLQPDSKSLSQIARIRKWIVEEFQRRSGNSLLEVIKSNLSIAGASSSSSSSSSCENGRPPVGTPGRGPPAESPHLTL